MTEKRFTYKNNKVYDNLTGEFHSSNMVSVNVLNELNDENRELRQELKEYKENWDDMVELATKTSLRNVELDEQIGQLRKELKEIKENPINYF